MSLTRRRFLQTTGSSFAALSSFDPRLLWSEALLQERASAIPAARRETLRAAVDEIIPAGDGQPSAGEIGAHDYIEVLCGKVPEISASVGRALDRIEQLSQSRYKRPFARIAPSGRVRLLKSFERESARASAGEGLYGSSGANLFALLRDLVYEAYYTNPRVWPALGYEFHPTSRKGPEMAAFDEAILARMKRAPKSYREVKR